jgi:hypothetical protein
VASIESRATAVPAQPTRRGLRTHLANAVAEPDDWCVRVRHNTSKPDPGSSVQPANSDEGLKVFLEESSYTALVEVGRLPCLGRIDRNRWDNPDAPGRVQEQKGAGVSEGIWSH